MKDEALLCQVAEAMREHDFLDDPRWARLSAGELSDSELAQLRRDMAALADVPPEKVQAAFEMLTQPAPEFQGRIESRFLRAGPARPTRLAQLFRLGPIVGLAAATAVALIVVLWPTASRSDLPAYELSFDAGDRQIRSAAPGPDAGPAVLGRGSLLNLRLRPTTRPGDPSSIGLVAFVCGDTDSRRLELPHRISESGVLVVEGVVAELLPVAAGAYRLLLVVVRKDMAGRIPEAPEAILTRGRDDPWQAFVVSIRIVDEP
jgi:hypothetical protein